MINFLNVVMPIRISIENGENGIFFVDFANGIVFDISGKQVDSSLKDEIMDVIRGEQQAGMPIIPYEKINEVMNTEKKLTEDNNKHIFRREE